MAEFPVTKPQLVVPSCVNLSTYIQGMSDYEVRCYYTQLVQQWAIEWGQTQQDWKTQQEAFESFKTYVNNKIAEFQNWFDNLDVQNEINNKLDDMIQDGTLSEIVASVLNGKYQPIVVNSTGDMTDRSAIYVLSSNGHVYQWGGSSFVDTSMIYNLPRSVYSFVGELPSNTNLRNPSGVNVGAYSFNKNNILGVPDDFIGGYGVYYLLYYTNASSHSALLFDLNGNMWFSDPYATRKVNDVDLSAYYKYVGVVGKGVNIENSNALQPGCYNFAAADVSGLPDDYKDLYGYVINYSYTNAKSLLRVLYDSGGNVWVSNGYGFHRVNQPFYSGEFPYEDIKTIPDAKYTGKLFTVSPTITNLPPEYDDSSYGFFYNMFSTPTASRVQVLFPAFKSSKIWTLNGRSDMWNQLGPSKQMCKEKVCFIGDSITAKTMWANVGFVDLIESWANCAVQNLGISGTGFKAKDPYINRVSQINEDTTLIAVSCSFNDLPTLPVGTAEDTGSDTLGGCMNTFFDSIQEKFPLIKIVGYTTNAWSSRRPGDSIAENYVNVFKTICENRCIPFSPVWKECNLRPWIAQQQKTYFTAPNGQTNQVHPNDEGHRVLAPIIYDLIHKVVAINM